MNHPDTPIRTSDSLRNVRYEIRGKLARRAQELARKGYEIISLNIGNPALFGFRTPETMRLAMIENFPESEGYCHQKGIFPAREAVVMQQQARGVTGVSVEEVFIGNGVSELIDLALRALLNDGDEVLVPSPDYPLWTAAVNLNRGRAIHYPCRPENGFVPDPAEIESLVTPRTRAIVIVNPKTRCASRCQGCRRSIGPAATGSAGRSSPGACALPKIFSRRWSCSPRCACAATCPGSGQCRPRSVAIRASES